MFTTESQVTPKCCCLIHIVVLQVHLHKGTANFTPHTFRYFWYNWQVRNLYYLCTIS